MGHPAPFGFSFQCTKCYNLSGSPWTGWSVLWNLWRELPMADVDLEDRRVTVLGDEVGESAG